MFSAMIALAAGLAVQPGGQTASLATADDLPDGAVLEQIADGLEHPWSLAFLPGGDVLVTEKPGRLRVIENGVLRPAPVEGAPQALYSGQGGLLDVVLHPDFEENNLVYLSWSEGDPRDNTLKLGRGRYENGRLEEFEEIFAAAPRRPTDVHYGARLVFLADRTLLMGIGDGFEFREQAQIPSSHYGSFVHLDDAGQPASQAVPGGAPGVYSYGHRNPQAVVRDPVTGAVYAHEHGPAGGDEINRLEAGANYGWPIASYGVDYTGMLVTPFETYPGMTDPVLHWTPSIAPAGMAVYRGEMFPEWSGDLLVAALIAGEIEGAGHIRRVDLEDGEAIAQEVFLQDRGWRIRDVRVAPDGSVWFVTDNGEDGVWRLSR